MTVSSVCRSYGQEFPLTWTGKLAYCKASLFMLSIIRLLTDTSCLKDEDLAQSRLNAQEVLVIANHCLTAALARQMPLPDVVKSYEQPTASSFGSLSFPASLQHSDQSASTAKPKASLLCDQEDYPPAEQSELIIQVASCKGFLKGSFLD